MYLLVFSVLLIAGLVAFVRLAPSEPGRWHQPITATSSSDAPGRATRVIEAAPGALARVDAAARALPRTTVLAGSVEAGRITYITRSAVIGFPDYTTVDYADGMLKMLARLRFGRSDLGVNRKRLERLIAAAQG
ncbi:MAG: DUF1499 domain-containing protein [Pseudomonadota bacterium]